MLYWVRLDQTTGTDAMSTFFPDLQRHSLLRTPDWRWRRARWLVDRGRYFSRRRDDAETGRAVQYLRALARSRSGRPAAALQGFADLHTARQLHEGTAPVKAVVQARLLARQTAPAIALRAGVPLPVVETYEALFFNVRGHLDARDWVLAHAIDPKVRPGTAVPDAGAVLKSFAYHGGPLALDAVLPYLLGGKELFDPPLDLSTAEGRQEQAVRLAVAAQMLPRDAATEAKLHRIMLILHERDRSLAVRRDPAALLARQTDSRVAEAFADDPAERGDDAERGDTAAVVAALCEIA